MLAQQRYEEALDHCEQEVALFTRVGDRVWQARALNACGWVLAQLGDHERALAACQQALSLLQAEGDRHGQAGAWDSIGYVHHHRGDLAEAVDCYRQALAIYRDLGDPGSEGSVLIHLGDMPVIGVPFAVGPLNGLDALLATVQVPPGVPVATVGIDNAKNAAHLAIRILKGDNFSGLGVQRLTIRSAMGRQTQREMLCGMTLSVALQS